MELERVGVTLESLKRGWIGGLDAAASLGLRYVQIAVGTGEITPELSNGERRTALQALKTRGLIAGALCGDLGGHSLERPDEHPWRIAKHLQQVDLAVDLECPIITMHIGVVPDDKSSERYKRMQDACAHIGGYAADKGVYIAIETGPESPETLKGFVDGIPCGVGINFDPANLVMVLGADPIKAVHTFGDSIRQVHVKDGRLLKYIGAEAIYGFFAEGGIGDMRMADYFLETPLGQGDARFAECKQALDDIGLAGVYCIERETGDDPMADIRMAVRYLRGI